MLNELKREAFEANLALPAHGLVNLNFGNASAVDRRKGIIAIKPSGMSYEKMRSGDMVLVDLEGRRVEGKLRPSSDTATHLEIYRSFEKACGVVHTRPRSRRPGFRSRSSARRIRISSGGRFP